MAYSTKVLDHYNNPRNVGSFDRADPTVGTGIVGAPECGDVMKLQIKVDPVTGRIEDARFKTFGCGSAIASSSLATEWLKGKTIDEARDIRNTSIVEELSLPPVKVHCSVLAEDAIKAAIKDYQDKQTSLAGSAATVRERLAAYARELGVGTLIAMLQIATLPADLTEKNLRLFASDVMRFLRGQGAEKPLPMAVRA